MFVRVQEGSTRVITPDLDPAHADLESLLRDEVDRAYRRARQLVFDHETPGIPPVRDAAQEEAVAELENAEQALRDFRLVRMWRQRWLDQELLAGSSPPTESSVTGPEVASGPTQERRRLDAR